MPASGFEFDVRDFLASLAKATARLETRAAEEQRQIAGDIVRDAKAKAPVETGRLRNSIHVAGETQHVDGPEVEVEAAAGYAAFVEFGTSTMRAEPYMRPAIAKAPGHAKSRYHI